MKIIKDFPPNIATIKKFFDIKDRGVVFAYGDTLYVPNGGEIEKHLLVHEETHECQMRGWDPEEWWNKYLTSSVFRLSQEVEACRNQYKYIKSQYKDKDLLSKVLAEMAENLSGKVYGYMVGFQKAKRLIKGWIF